MKKVFFILFITILLSACIKPCIEARGIESAGLNITFFHIANNEYFYPSNKNLSPYDIDSLRVTDSRGRTLRTPYLLTHEPNTPSRAFYYPELYPIFIPEDDLAAFGSEQTKYIYIKYNYNTFDTLKLVFKAKKEKCANKFEYLKAYYKNLLIAEAYDSYSKALAFKLNH